MGRFGRRKRSQLRSGINLVTDAYGGEYYSDEVAIGRYGKQAGKVIAIKDLDEPGHEELRAASAARARPEPTPKHNTGTPKQVFRLKGSDGLPI